MAAKWADGSPRTFGDGCRTCGDASVFIDNGPGKQERIHASSPSRLKDSGEAYCHIRVGIPIEKVIAPANQNLIKSLASLSLAGLIGVICAWLYGEIAITSKLKLLLDAVRHLGSPGSRVKSGIPHEDGEIGELATGFDKLAADLEWEERELRESEERFRRLAENSPDVIFRLELPSGRYDYVSPSIQQLTGYTQKEYYTTPMMMRKLMPPDWLNFYDAQWSKLLTGEDVPRYYEYPVIHKSGEERWVRESNVLVWGEDGKPQFLEGVVTDITGRRQAEAALKDAMSRLENSLQLIEESEERYRGLFESMAQGVIYFDADGKILSANPAAERIFGRAEGDNEDNRGPGQHMGHSG